MLMSYKSVGEYEQRKFFSFVPLAYMLMLSGSDALSCDVRQREIEKFSLYPRSSWPRAISLMSVTR